MPTKVWTAVRVMFQGWKDEQKGGTKLMFQPQELDTEQRPWF